jgi:hypothetical protein
MTIDNTFADQRTAPPPANSNDTGQPLIRFWQNSRAFFQEHAPSVVTQIDNEASRYARLCGGDQPFFICALGQSAVGI